MTPKRLTEIQALKAEIQIAMKGKGFKNLSSSDKVSYTQHREVIN